MIAAETTTGGSMVGIVIRALSTIVAVVVAVVVASVFGDTAPGKIWAAVLIAVVVGTIEWFLIWAPKHLEWARRLLDPRSAHVGVWLQVVTTTVGDDRKRLALDRNRFAVYWVEFAEGIYKIVGFAYGIGGRPMAQWRSIGSPEFTSDGRSMTYRFKGEIIKDDESAEDETADDKAVGDEEADDVDRTGIANMDLLSRTGRVDHVGERRVLVFDIERVTDDLLARLGVGDVSPGDVKNSPSTRNRVAKAYADRLRAESHT